MKIPKVFLETILPITIGTILFISFFYIKEKLSFEPELASCERYELSTAVYLIFGLVILLISSLYQIIIGNWILKRSSNKYVLNIFNSIILGVLFTSIHIGMVLFNRKAIEIKFCVVLFVIMFLLGLLFSVLKIATIKYSNKV
jgi:hypothetical protein